MTDYILQQIHDAEVLVTKTMKGDKRACIELYMTMPGLFEKCTRSYTLLEPKLYEANRKL